MTSDNQLPKHWKVKKFDDLLDYIQPTKYIVESTEYNDSYKTPVLTAGKSFIKGYTNEESGIFDALPVIIFDDFTTATKFVNFPFKVKSSAMKILSPKNPSVNIKFAYYYMQTLNISTDTHKRFWISVYSKIKVPYPSPEEQLAIVSKIEELLSDLDNGILQLQTALQQLKVYRQSLLKWAFEGKLSNKKVKDGELPKGWKWVKLG
jgi:type I restriction enzyme S subunit